MREVNAIIALDKEHINYKTRSLIIDETENRFLIKIRTFNNKKGDDETILQNIYHHLIELGIDVYNIEINVLWDTFEY